MIEFRPYFCAMTKRGESQAKSSSANLDMEHEVALGNRSRRFSVWFGRGCLHRSCCRLRAFV